MSATAISIVGNISYATSFYGGTDRGKVIQFHMEPKELKFALSDMVEDSNDGHISTFEEWLRSKSNNVATVLFDSSAEPKVSSVPIIVEMK